MGRLADNGSSPRTWGTLIRPAIMLHLRRFIPTHVGNTLPHRKASLIIFGSSPRTWGTLEFIERAHFLLRFIPTHVGNTPLLWSQLLHQPVHPHARGEHIQVACEERRINGSSPRTWGTHFFHLAEFRTEFNESKFYQIFRERSETVRGEKIPILPRPTPPEFFCYFPTSQNQNQPQS